MKFFKSRFTTCLAGPLRRIEASRRVYYLLFTIVLVGGFFRFYNLDWDQGHMFHPDERNIANAVSRLSFFNQLNPGFFAYGGFSIYLIRATGDLIIRITNNPSWTFDWGHINLIGRFYSALFSTLVIFPLFLLTKRVFDKQIALLSIIIYALSVSSIQSAHFGVTESLLSFCASLIAYLSIDLFEKPNFSKNLKTGAILGIAIAAKITGIAFAIFPLIAYCLTKQAFFKKITSLFLIFIIASLVFTVFSPYTFLTWNKFTESMRYESGVATGSLPVVYTLQFTKTIPYLFQIENFFWQLGPIFFCSILGFFLIIFRLVKNKNLKLVIFLSWPILYFLYVGTWQTKFIRYMAPILPFLIVFSAYFLSVLINKIKLLGKILTFFFLLATILWALAFFSIYTREQTRIAASEWIYKNVPLDSKILTEHWDDGLPVPLKMNNPSQCQAEALTIYEPDNQDKINYYANKLSSADYIVINSRRLYGTLVNLSQKYPITSKYYQLLFAEKLGFIKVAEFTSYPSILGFEINDDSSEETFQVYDHPKVLIFKNNSHPSGEEIKIILSN